MLKKFGFKKNLFHLAANKDTMRNYNETAHVLNNIFIIFFNHFKFIRI